MIDHTGIASEKIAASRAFYQAAFAALGGGELWIVPPDHNGGGLVVGFARERPVFWIHEGAPGPVRHVAFSALDRAQVDAFYAAAMAAGGRDNGRPGLRPLYHPDYYGAFILDSDGNNIEAVCHAPA